MSPTSNTSRPQSMLASMAPPPRIDILLPVKERFGPKNAGAISGVVHDLVTASQTPDLFHVFGHPVDTPFDDIAFTAIAPRHSWLHGRNIGLGKAYLYHLKNRQAPALVEVHSRCQVASYIKRQRPDLNVALYLHNDPREMAAGRSTAERDALLRSMSLIICISDYIRECFLDGLDVPPELVARVRTARNGVDRWLKAPAKKTKTVLLVGRVVPEKGILECASALATVLTDRPEWKVVIAGAKRFENAKKDSYGEAVFQALAPLGERAKMTGYLEKSEIRALQQEAEIIACPSLWQEPMGKTVIEALAAGSALLTTRRGGIPEAAEGRAHIIDNPNAETFVAALEKLVDDDAYRAGLQQAAWDDFPFTASRMADEADAHRAATFQQILTMTNRH